MVQHVLEVQPVLLALQGPAGIITIVTPIKEEYLVTQDMFGMDIIATHLTMFNAHQILNGMDTIAFQVKFIVLLEPL